MRLLMLLAFILGISAFSAQAHHIPDHPDDVTVKVDGLVCDICAQSIEKVFKKRDEIDNVDINLDTHEVALDFKSGKTMNDKDINTLIYYAGYTVVKIIR